MWPSMRKINEIFYSLQGEGMHAGRPAVFIRFAGCNLQCSFCDTDFSVQREMSDEEIRDELRKYPASFVVLTGGEPTLSVDRDFIRMLKEEGRYVAIETNGTQPIPQGIDWVCCSPKGVGEYLKRISVCNELKVVYQGQDLAPYFDCKAEHYLLQPCDTGDAARNRELTQAAIRVCLDDPRWRLSLQTHKLIGIR